MTATDYNQKTIDTFHAQQGRGVAPWGDNLLLMTAKGAVSGTAITTPVVQRMRDGKYVIVASKGGTPEHPTWYRNIQVNPVVDIEVAGESGIDRFKARATVLPDGPEHDELYAYMAEVWPGFNEYQARVERTIPIVLLEPLD